VTNKAEIIVKAIESDADKVAAIDGLAPLDIFEYVIREFGVMG